MSFAAYSFLTGVMLLALFSSFAGCLSIAVGDTSYSDNSIMVNVSHAGAPADVSVQVTVYRVANLNQEKYTIVSAPVTLVNGENIVTVPIRLEPGSYKLYVYVLSDGDRKTAVIRDIVV